MALAELDALEPLALTRRHQVLLVDDDPAVLGSLRRLLRHEPYDLLVTISPELALRWIDKSDVSLVVVDQRMPEMCGTELAARVRRSSPGTIRVMLTAYPGATTVQHGLTKDLQWLISKPWNDDALRLTLRQLLHHRESQPPDPGPVDGSRSTGRSDPRSGPGDSEWVSWLPARAFGQVLKTAVRSLGWTLGFLGTTDAGGSFPH